MPKVSLLAKVTAKEGKGDDLVAAFEPLIEQVRKEPGTLLYVMNRSKNDPDVFWFMELYADDDAFAAHGSSEAMAAATPALGAAIAESELSWASPSSPWTCRADVSPSRHSDGYSTIWVQRWSAMVRPVPSFVTVTSQTCVVRPTCAGTATPTTTSPGRALPRKFVLSSTVVNVAPSGRLAPVPAAHNASASPTITGAQR